MVRQRPGCTDVPGLHKRIRVDHHDHYPGIFEGWDLSVPISFSRPLKGRTITGGVGGEGDMRGSIGANFTYKRNLQVGVTYMGYFGNAEVVNQREFRALTDRDQLSLVMKYSF